MTTKSIGIKEADLIPMQNLFMNSYCFQNGVLRFGSSDAENYRTEFQDQLKLTILITVS